MMDIFYLHILKYEVIFSLANDAYYEIPLSFLFKTLYPVDFHNRHS